MHESHGLERESRFIEPPSPESVPLDEGWWLQTGNRRVSPWELLSHSTEFRIGVTRLRIRDTDRMDDLQGSPEAKIEAPAV